MDYIESCGLNGHEFIILRSSAACHELHAHSLLECFMDCECCTQTVQTVLNAKTALVKREWNGLLKAKLYRFSFSFCFRFRSGFRFQQITKETFFEPEKASANVRLMICHSAAAAAERNGGHFHGWNCTVLRNSQTVSEQEEVNAFRGGAEMLKLPNWKQKYNFASAKLYFSALHELLRAHSKWCLFSPRSNVARFAGLFTL